MITEEVQMRGKISSREENSKFLKRVNAAHVPHDNSHLDMGAVYTSICTSLATQLNTVSPSSSIVNSVNSSTAQMVLKI